MKTKLIFTLIFLCFFTGNAQWDLIRYQNNQFVLCVVNKDSLATATHGSGKIHYSMDGGDFWPSYQTSYGNCLFQDIHFITDEIGYASGGSYFGMYQDVLLKTTDGGKTWIDLTFSTPGGSVFSNVFFIDENIGFVTGDGGRLLKTMDGGLNFSPVSVSQSNIIYGDIAFPTDNIGYVSVVEYINSGNDYVYRIYKTTDQGENWAKVHTSNKGIIEIQFLNTNTGFGVGNDGLFLKTTDGGITWNKQLIPPYTNLTSVFFTSPTTGYINNAGGIYKTTDGGATWTVQNIFPLDIIREIRFANDTIGYALGKDGIYKTINGGGTGLRVENVEAKSKLIVYPNPAKETLYLKTAAQLSIEKIKLFDMRGKTVREFPSGSRQLDISNLAPGNYFLQLQLNGEKVVERIVVK